jgi:hypothetical protein
MTLNEQALVRVLAVMLVKHEFSPYYILQAIRETTGDKP